MTVDCVNASCLTRQSSHLAPAGDRDNYSILAENLAKAVKQEHDNSRDDLC